MDRRETLKLLLLSAVSSRAWLGTVSATAQPPGFASDWDQWPDMRWAGPAFWGNRLQDWELESGVVTCRVAGPNRTLHCLTRRLSDTAGDFLTRVDVAFTDEVVDGYVGFRVGAKGRNVDYRSAAVFGEGLDAGVTAMGELFIGDVNRARAVDTTRPLTLELEASPQAGAYRLTLTARAAASGDVVDRLIRDDVASSELSGNVALVSHLEGEGRGASFAGWRLEGSKILADDDAVFGPIAFAQYTVHRDTLKLTAQLMPLESLGGVEVTLEVRNDSETSWRQLGRASIDPLSRTIRFRIDGFREDRPLPYRVRLSVPLASGRRDFFYEGTIAEEPALEAPLRAAVFSCNADHGFPDTEVVENVSRHRPDLAIFLGDQFYESSGGFGIQTAPLDDACLDMLRKWYLFGWSYRNIFRHVPAAFLPDDHDVYHGNIWGEGGKEAPTDRGFGAEAQDRGGYKMDPEWVNVVQRCQMSHLPDPFDPTPAERGIDVYYTGWDYGGVSFALLEDRKFKSAPANVLPQEAQVFNG